MRTLLRSMVALLMLAAVLVPATMAPVSAAAPASEDNTAACAQYYVVRRGDNLYRIARNHGTTIRTLQTLNGIRNPNRIYAGQRLCVRAGSQQGNGFWYTVRRGDTLTSIARRYNVTVSSIAAANRLSNPNRIYAGQRLFIPGKSAYNPGAAALLLSPTRGSSGTQVQVTARGFPPNATITVGIGPEYSEFTQVARGTTDASGTFTTRVRIQGQAGTTWIVGAHTAAGGGYPEANATARFQIIG